MLLSIWTLFVAITLSVIAGYYSVIGLATIFSATPIPVIVMSATMEVAKVTSAVWLHHYWDRAKWTMKLYLVVSVVMLSLITSMGVFGLLSRAHADQGAVSGDIADRLAVLDERIKTERDNIESARRTLSQMSQGVDQTIARSTTEQSVNRAVQLRKSQTKERNDLQKIIQDSQTRITQLNEERAPISAQMRKSESEVGPIKYIAAMVYGDNPDSSLLERAVRWVIVLLVSVFDPLAITLVLAANESIKWTRELKRAKVPVTTEPDPEPEPECETEDEHCPKCDAVLLVCPGIGPYCPNPECDVVDNILGVDWGSDPFGLQTKEEPKEIVKEEPKFHSQGIPVIDFAWEEPEPVQPQEPEIVEEFTEKFEVVEPVEEVHSIEPQLSKESSKVWKRMNPEKTLREQHKLVSDGELEHLPWEDQDFIDQNVKNK